MTYRLKNIGIILLLLIVTLNACKSDKNPKHIDLAEGFYYLNGTDNQYMVERDSEKPELYFINPEPIFEKSDFESAELIEEDNGYYGILFKLKPLSFTKWETVLNSKVHYIGFVSNNRLKNLIKLKGENSSSELYISCYTNSREEADLLKAKY